MRLLKEQRGCEQRVRLPFLCDRRISRLARSGYDRHYHRDRLKKLEPVTSLRGCYVSDGSSSRDEPVRLRIRRLERGSSGERELTSLVASAAPRARVVRRRVTVERTPECTDCAVPARRA